MTSVVNVRKHLYEIQKAKASGLYVYVGRGQGSIWGNPFSYKQESLAKWIVPKDEVLVRYEEWLMTQNDLLAQLPALKGKVLGCWCKPAPCHGDILARLADSLTFPA